ncbi:MAG: class I SAM-dependent methyltransferase [Proteobacteria bacterium]|nr:MAG: class I SAM-dependent methyltransferase [Pseudomonadota bacterium]
MREAAYRQFEALERSHFWFRARRRIFLALLDRFFPARAQSRVLEVGCGTGGFLQPLQRYGDVDGLEISLDCAKRSRVARGCKIVNGNAERLPFADDTYDLVCLFDVLEHTKDDLRAMIEVGRVLKPGGVAFFSVPAYQFLFANNDRVAEHQRRYTRTALRATIESAGLVIEKSSYFNTFLFPIILPIVLARKCVEGIRGFDPGDRTNLDFPVPTFIGDMLYRVMALEAVVLTRHSFPVGHSLVAIVSRPPTVSAERISPSGTQQADDDSH